MALKKYVVIIRNQISDTTIYILYLSKWWRALLKQKMQSFGNLLQFIRSFLIMQIVGRHSAGSKRLSDFWHGWQDHQFITFPQLSEIYLINLANLQNFSPTASYSFKMPNLRDFHLVRCPQVGNKPFLRIIAQRVTVYSDEPPGKHFRKLSGYTRRINNLESVGESSYSNQDVETETVRLEEEEERVAEKEEEGVVVQEENEIQEETWKTWRNRRRKKRNSTVFHHLSFLFYFFLKISQLVLFLFFKGSRLWDFKSHKSRTEDVDWLEAQPPSS